MVHLHEMIPDLYQIPFKDSKGRSGLERFEENKQQLPAGTRNKMMQLMEVI
jgi:hypothetical protein